LANFNPRTHKECDTKVILINRGGNHFDSRTHEECDLWKTFMLVRLTNFNPRTHEECDINQPFRPTATRVFQSTHSRGVRHFSCLSCGSRPYFNPRTHEECDLDQWTRHTTVLFISIHALTRSATNRQRGHIGQVQRFQSTHSRGVRRTRSSL